MIAPRLWPNQGVELAPQRHASQAIRLVFNERAGNAAQFGLDDTQAPLSRVTGILRFGLTGVICSNDHAAKLIILEGGSLSSSRDRLPRIYERHRSGGGSFRQTRFIALVELL